MPSSATSRHCVTLRLQAFSDAPAAFGSTYERECARTTADWQRWISTGATFIAEGSDHPGGLAAGLHDEDDRFVVYLMSMWVQPALRGSGAADALVTAVLAWAAEDGAREARLHVVAGNDRAERCYERNGFRRTGRELVRERDGSIEIEMTCPLSQPT